MPSTNVLKRALHQRNPEPFGRYQLLGRIASGGMAEVYVARCGELEGLQTLLAVKRILPVYAADETFVRLFQREASILLRLQHTGIARLFEVGKVGEHWFVAMELVQGETLAQVDRALRDAGGSWDPALVAHIGAEVANALHHAHSLRDAAGRPLGIVHRDVSPQNIMLGFDGSVKVIDFGIARWEAPQLDTGMNAIRGKVQYLSPEQASGGRVDGRSDVFSLAVVLYELLNTGKLFDRGTNTATLEAVLEAPAAPIPHVPEPLNAALMNALSKNPRERYRSGAVFAQALMRTVPPDRAVGAEEIASLVSSLFPQRLLRWRQIQEMATAGHGFVDVLVPTGGDGPVIEMPVPPAINAPYFHPGPTPELPIPASDGDYVSGYQLSAVAAPPRRRLWPWVGYAAAAMVALAAGVAVGPLMKRDELPVVDLTAGPPVPAGPTVEPIVRPHPPEPVAIRPDGGAPPETKRLPAPGRRGR